MCLLLREPSSSTGAYVLKRGSICNVSLCSVSSNRFYVNSTQEHSAHPIHPPRCERLLSSLCFITEPGVQSSCCRACSAAHPQSVVSPHCIPSSGCGTGSQARQAWHQCRAAAPLQAAHGRLTLLPQPAPPHKPHAQVKHLQKHLGPFPSQALHNRCHVQSLTSQVCWAEAYIPAEEMEGGQVKLRPSRQQQFARSWGCTARVRTARARGKGEECGNSGKKLAGARLSHIWRLPGHGLSSAGGGRAVMH